MASKLKAAREVVQDRGEGSYWIDHAEVLEEDFAWLQAAKQLTLWNVRLPDRFLRKLQALWWLDLRGGTATNLDAAEGCSALRYLQINQVRGLSDLTLLPSFDRLELLSLYGLPKVTDVPSLEKLNHLRRVEIGQLKGLSSIEAVLEAPRLTELVVVKSVGIIDKDIRKINSHPTLTHFAWFAEDVPRRVCQPVLDKIEKQQARAMHAGDWFAGRGTA